MSLISTLERRLGHLAIPGLVTILAGFQVAVWLMLVIQPLFLDFIILDRDRVLSGQVWRVVTWVFIPVSSSPIFVLFGALLMMTFSSVMDQAWGAFRVNLYVYGGIFSMVAGALIFDSPPMGLTLYTCIFLAFCCIVPDYEIMLFFILPIKVKYLGMITGALMLLNFIDSPGARVSIIFSLLNFFVAFGPGFIKGVKTKAAVSDRRARFESAKAPEAAHFHKCQQCGKTDLDDPYLDFRVTAEGEEYCTVCRPRK